MTNGSSTATSGSRRATTEPRWPSPWSSPIPTPRPTSAPARSWCRSTPPPPCAGGRVPADRRRAERGAGFAIAQDRLGPGRIHHCMRAIGSAERAFELMCRRAHDRRSFGGPLAEKQFVQDFIAKSRMEIDSARLMVLHAAWKMDTEGKRAARQDISMIKVIAAQMHQRVLDRAMQVHGALGMSDDTPLAAMWRQGRWLRIADGPDEVHKMVIAVRELNRFKPREPAVAEAPAAAVEA